MCMPSAPEPPPPPAQMQSQTAPKELYNDKSSLGRRRRRGLYAAILTAPAGVGAAPSVTGTTGGVTGG